MRFVSGNQWRWREGQRMDRRRLPTSTMSWLTAGRGEATCAGERFRLAAPCLHVIPAGAWHGLVHDPGHPFASVSIHYQASLPSGLELVASLGFPVVIPLHSQRDRPLYEAMQAMARLDARRPTGWLVLAQAELVRALGYVVLHHGDRFDATPVSQIHDHQRLTPALQVIDEQLLSGPVRVRDLAAACGCSPVHLRTMFHQAFDMPPHQYVQSRRVALACQLLRQSDESVVAVGAAVGVPEPRVFHRLFKRITGMTPTAYRESGLE